MRESLKSARRAAGLTQQAMADKLGISLRYYQPGTEQVILPFGMIWRISLESIKGF